MGLFPRDRKVGVGSLISTFRTWALLGGVPSILLLGVGSFLLWEFPPWEGRGAIPLLGPALGILGLLGVSGGSLLVRRSSLPLRWGGAVPARLPLKEVWGSEEIVRARALVRGRKGGALQRPSLRDGVRPLLEGFALLGEAALFSLRFSRRGREVVVAEVDSGTLLDVPFPFPKAPRGREALLLQTEGGEVVVRESRIHLPGLSRRVLLLVGDPISRRRVRRIVEEDLLFDFVFATSREGRRIEREINAWGKRIREDRTPLRAPIERWERALLSRSFCDEEEEVLQRKLEKARSFTKSGGEEGYFSAPLDPAVVLRVGGISAFSRVEYDYAWVGCVRSEWGELDVLVTREGPMDWNDFEPHLKVIDSKGGSWKSAKEVPEPPQGVPQEFDPIVIPLLRTEKGETISASTGRPWRARRLSPEVSRSLLEE